MEEEHERAEQGGDTDLAPVAGIVAVEGTGIPKAWTIDGHRVALELDLTIYSVDAILRAAYKFTDRCYLYVVAGNGTLVVVLTSKTPCSAEGTEALIGEFSNEVLDQRLRESLAKEFGPVQRLIAAQAFSEVNLVDPERDAEDYRADPRGIGGRR